MRSWLPVLALAVSLGGCQLYFGGDDEPDPCSYGGVAAPDYLGSYRDPQTASCIQSGGGGCDSGCGRCAEIAAPDMGLCESDCTGLPEATCQSTSGCYAAYFDDDSFSGDRRFEGCWQTAPSGPIQGTCSGLDAYQCARHDDCALVYAHTGGAAKFIACEEESAAYCSSDSECGDGSHCDTTTCYPPPGCDGSCPTCGVCAEVCYGVCVPDSQSCATVDCGIGYHCEEQCYPTDLPNPGGVMGYCETACVPNEPSCALLDCGPGYECVETCEDQGGDLWCGAYCAPTGGDPGSCDGEVACAAPPPACPSGTTPGRTNGCWSGYCIPNSDCGPSDPGQCYLEVACDEAPPACPSGTTPGVSGACWSGYCIPTDQCAPETCETLDTEAECAARGDCTPVYTGTNCTCTENGCTCEMLTYARCEAWLL